MLDLVQICNANFSFLKNFSKRIHLIESFFTWLTFRQLKIISAVVLAPAVPTLVISSWKYFLTPVLHNWLLDLRLFLHRSLFCWLLPLVVLVTYYTGCSSTGFIKTFYGDFADFDLKRLKFSFFTQIWMKS